MKIMAEKFDIATDFCEKASAWMGPMGVTIRAMQHCLGVWPNTQPPQGSVQPFMYINVT